MLDKRVNLKNGYVPEVEPLSVIARIADALMVPLMCILAGTFNEAPQRTHFWNNAHLTSDEVKGLDKTKMLSCPPKAKTVRGKVHFHLPVFGGWKDYTVISPSHLTSEDWYIGWISADVCGYSRTPLSGPVRVLLSNWEIAFFGIKADGQQIPVIQIGEGKIGDGGPWKDIPLR